MMRCTVTVEVLVVFLLGFNVEFGSTFFSPKIFIAKDHYDFGFQIGQQYKNNILLAFQNNSFYNGKALPYNKTAEGSELYSKFLSSANTTFPQYVDELRGMADGIGLSFSELFLWNMLDEMELLLEPKESVPSCSDLYIANGETQTLMAHNEDGLPADNITSYFLGVQVGSTNESFLSLCYAGELCGNAFGFGLTSGMVVTVNALFPKNVSTDGMVRNFLNRALLTSSSSEIERILKAVPTAAGFSMNVGSIDGFNVSNFEVSSLGVVETVIHGFGYHFNSYIHGNVSQNDDPSSTHREARVKQFPPPSNSTQMLGILGDSTDHQYPLYRTASSPDDSFCTIATALYDLSGKMFHMYKGNPATSNPVLSVTLNTGFRELYDVFQKKID